MHKHKKKVLFICRIADYLFGSNYSGPGRISGLRNSAGFCAYELNKAGIESKLVVVNDNNDIDREVNKYKPTHVIIEALWVVPEKFDILQKLHPKIEWIIRLHSELPFVSGEGIAIDWLIRYVDNPRVSISGNSKTLNADLTMILNSTYQKDMSDKVIFLPNCYHFKKHEILPVDKDHINIGCFGAIRPLKNQLIQAVSAIDFGEWLDTPINFHMNADRIEQLGGPVLKNIKALFDHSPRHKLVLHEWMDHHTFLNVLTTMDVSMQVSFSESFNIVSADAVSVGVPIVVSPEIYWASNVFKVGCTNREDITSKLIFAYNSSFYNLQHLNRLKLLKTAKKAADTWVEYFS